MTTSSSISLIQLLHRASKSADALLEGEVKSGLTARQITVLSVIADHPGASQSRVVREAGGDPATIADIMKRLIGRGVVERERDPHDTRAYRLHLTDEGRQVLKKSEPAQERAVAALLARIPNERRAELPQLVRALGYDG